MIIYFNISEFGPSPGMMKREWGNICKAAWQNIGGFWQSELLPVHFTMVGFYRYGYRPRGGQFWPRTQKGFKSTTWGRKVFPEYDPKWKGRSGWKKSVPRAAAEQQPLVWTGDSRTLSATGRVLPTKYGVKITIPAPTLNRLPFMREEVTRITDDEREGILKRFGILVNQALKRWEGRKVSETTISGSMQAAKAA